MIYCEHCVYWKDAKDSFGACQKLFDEVICETEDNGIQATMIQTPYDFECIFAIDKDLPDE